LLLLLWLLLLFPALLLVYVFIVTWSLLYFVAFDVDDVIVVDYYIIGPYISVVAAHDSAVVVDFVAVVIGLLLMLSLMSLL